MRTKREHICSSFVPAVPHFENANQLLKSCYISITYKARAIGLKNLIHHYVQLFYCLFLLMLR